MGGEVILLMEKGESKKVKTFLSSVLEKGDDGTLWSKSPLLPGTKQPYGCWLGFKGNRIEVGYTASWGDDKWATTIACGIRDHFQVRKGGWDSVGYCNDFMITRPFRIDINMTEKQILRGNGKNRGIIKLQQKRYQVYTTNTLLIYSLSV